MFQLDPTASERIEGINHQSQRFKGFKGFNGHQNIKKSDTLGEGVAFCFDGEATCEMCCNDILNGIGIREPIPSHIMNKEHLTFPASIYRGKMEKFCIGIAILKPVNLDFSFQSSCSSFKT